MEYFKSINANIPGEMDIDAITLPNSQTMLINLGGDTVTWRNFNDTHRDSIELDYGNGFNKIAYHPSGNYFLLGGSEKQVHCYSIDKQNRQLLYESMGSINDIKYSSTGRYVIVASEEPKVIVIDTLNKRNLKCRPGHKNKVYNTFTSAGDQYIVSIGEDGFVLIYELSAEKDPQQVFRTQFTNQPVPPSVKGCFSQVKNGHRVYLPGTKDIQTIQFLNNRWQIKKTNMGHTSPILVVQTINQHKLVTSCETDLCIWSIQAQQKITVLEGAALLKILPIPNSFIGHRNDGYIYIYDRPIHVQNEIEVEKQEESNRSKIQFNNDEQDNIELEYEDEGFEQEQRDYIKISKKRKADKIVKVFPQNQLFRTTSFYDENRFLFVNLYGCIIESRQMDESSIYVQFNRGNRQPQTKLLFKNKQLKYFDMNSQVVCYAGQSVYGLKIDNFTSWEQNWSDIVGVALSGSWMAVANISQIRFIDISGNLIKALCFDRPILYMAAYQNLLAVVYHQSIPMFQSQMLAMKIFTVSQFSISELPQCHVPLSIVDTDTTGSTLIWFGFSEEGMIFSQDSFGVLRAYSLQTNQWVPINLQESIDSKKAWIIGFQRGQILYWKTNDSDPEPSVRPRLNVKTNKLEMVTLEQMVPQIKQLPNLLWQRYCLDHEMARYKLWGRHKHNRNEKHINYHLSESIMNEQKIHERHLKLDVEMLSIIKYFIKHKINKAIGFIKNNIRSIQTGKQLIEMLDACNHRSEAIELQFYYEEKQRQIDYEAMQQLGLKQLKSKVQTEIKIKKENPLNPKFKKTMQNPIPYSIPSSQPSQISSIMEDITHKSQQNSKSVAGDGNNVDIENPFLKKKSTSDRKQEIEQHIQKYGVKRKVEEKKKPKN